MQYKYVRQVIIGLAFALTGQAVLAQTSAPVQPQTPAPVQAQNNLLDKTQVCVACHGPDGNSAVAMWPKLAGQHAQYLLKQLQAFKLGDKGPRNVPAMYGMVSNLTPTDMQQLAEYYAAQKTSPGAARPDLVDAGSKIYRGGNRNNGVPACAGCHGPTGQGNAQAGFPKLSGQQTDYIVQQLIAYQKGDRRTDANGIMRDIAKNMDQKQMEAVASYISGLY